MDNLYYTLASLPTLDLAGPSPFADQKAFWDYVDHVPDEWKQQLSIAEPSEPTVKDYRSWDLALRVALARLRLEGLPWKDQEASLPSLGGDRMTEAIEALEQATPLEAERYLDELRWSYLDSVGQGHAFDRTAFFVYALKLELVQRRVALAPNRGLEVFDGLHAAILAKTDLTIPTGEQS